MQTTFYNFGVKLHWDVRIHHNWQHLLHKSCCEPWHTVLYTTLIMRSISVKASAFVNGVQDVRLMIICAWSALSEEFCTETERGTEQQRRDTLCPPDHNPQSFPVLHYSSSLSKAVPLATFCLFGVALPCRRHASYLTPISTKPPWVRSPMRTRLSRIDFVLFHPVMQRICAWRMVSVEVWRLCWPD